ncbi:MAG: hypothetical protein AAGG48_10380 [Planctomycetota bacterium]
MNRLRQKVEQTQLCPVCDQSISADDINLKEGVALCPSCGKLIRLSELNLSGRPNQQVIHEPPAGCSASPVGNGAVVRATLRSLAGCVMCFVFAAFWNGIVSVFVLVAIAGLYANLIGPVPDWFPAPGVENGEPIMNDAPMGMGETLFLCVFLIPFVTIGLVLIGVMLVQLCGRVEVVIQQEGSFVATGVGFLKYKKHFDPNQVSSIEFSHTSWQSDGEAKRVLEIKSDRTIKFGSMLTDDRIEWMRVVLYELVMNSNSSVSRSNLPKLTWIHR